MKSPVGMNGFVLRCNGSLVEFTPCYNYINLSTKEECDKESQQQKWRKHNDKIYCPYCVEELRQQYLACGRLLREFNIHEEDLKD